MKFEVKLSRSAVKVRLVQSILTLSYNQSCNIKYQELILIFFYRHEVPVTAEPIEIIEDNKDVLVVNKPSSIPVHPCGRYRHNSLVFILAKDYNYHNLRSKGFVYDYVIIKIKRTYPHLCQNAAIA